MPNFICRNHAQKTATPTEEGRFRYIGIPKDLLTAYQDRLIYADGDAAPV